MSHTLQESKDDVLEINLTFFPEESKASNSLRKASALRAEHEVKEAFNAMEHR